MGRSVPGARHKHPATLPQALEHRDLAGHRAWHERVLVRDGERQLRRVALDPERLEGAQRQHRRVPFEHHVLGSECRAWGPRGPGTSASALRPMSVEQVEGQRRAHPPLSERFDPFGLFSLEPLASDEPLESGEPLDSPLDDELDPSEEPAFSCLARSL